MASFDTDVFDLVESQIWLVRVTPMRFSPHAHMHLKTDKNVNFSNYLPLS